MNKTLRSIVGLSCLIITGLFAHYFLSYLPKKDMMALQKECMEIGEKTIKKDEADMKNFQGGEISSSDYVFDAELKRCLYKSFFAGSAMSEEYIYDLFTNKRISGYMESKDGVFDGNKVEYIILKEKYF